MHANTGKWEREKVPPTLMREEQTRRRYTAGECGPRHRKSFFVCTGIPAGSGIWFVVSQSAEQSCPNLRLSDLRTIS